MHWVAMKRPFLDVIAHLDIKARVSRRMFNNVYHVAHNALKSKPPT